MRPYYIKRFKFRMALETPGVGTGVGYSFLTGINIWTSPEFKGFSIYVLGFGISFEYGDWIFNDPR